MPLSWIFLLLLLLFRDSSSFVIAFRECALSGFVYVVAIGPFQSGIGPYAVQLVILL